MKQGRIEIDMKGPVAGHSAGDSIKLDGVPIQNCIRAIAIPRTAVGELLHVELDIIAMPGCRFAGSAYIGLPDGTADLLISMGWTPPDGPNADKTPDTTPTDGAA